MKLTVLFLALTAAVSFGQATNYTNFIRQTQQGTGVVWDMTSLAASGSAASALNLETGGSLFQLWTVNKTTAKDYLLDQKLVGAYLPKADVVIKTLDPYVPVRRTRIDKAFSVEVTVANLVAAGVGIPDAATRVLLEQHIANYPANSTTLDPAVVAANTATYKGYISTNGKTTLNYVTSALKASPDPRKATGEEHFIVHALADGTITQSQISSAKVAVYPVASGLIQGITPNAEYRYQLPALNLTFSDLYPGSTSYLMLYEGNGVTGPSVPLVTVNNTDQAKVKTSSDSYDVLNPRSMKDGTYTLAMISTTPYGTEYLADLVPFTVRRAITVNAMQVNYTDGNSPNP